MHSRTRLWLSVAALTFSALPAVAAITGTVINADGAPVAGAKVSLYAPETIDARRARLVSKVVLRTPLGSVTTGSTGAFSIDSPKGQSLLDLHIEAAGFAPGATRVVPDEDIGAQPLVAAAAKTGTITANGKPVAGATVVWIGEAEYTVQTDAGGKYPVPDPDKWASRLMIFHPDYAPLEESLGQFGSNKKGPDRSLLPGVSLSGRIVASDGASPVGKAAVLVDSWPLTVSADDGTFTVAHAPREWEQLNAAAGDRGAARVHTTGALTLKLVKAAAISGTVRDARTQLPVAGVEVRIGSTGPRTVVALGGMAFTDAKGNYTLTPVTPGMYQINAARPGFSTLPVNISITAGQVLQKAIFLNERGRITGTVLDEDKRPVAGARLSAHGGGRNRGIVNIGRGANVPALAASGADGRYVLRAVDAGPEIIVDAAKRGLPAAHTADLKLAVGEKKTGVNIIIPRGLAFSGIVTDGNGKPLSGVTVDASEFEDGGMPNVRRMMVGIRNGNSGDDQLVRTGSDGGFSIKLKEGKYDVSFKREGFSTKSLRGQQVVANAKPVEVKLDPGVEITGRVTRAGVPVEGANVSAISQDGLSNTQTLPDGSFHLGDLTPGSYMVNVNKMDSFIQTMRSVNAPARDVNVDLPAGGRVSGRVTDKNSNQPVTTFQAGVTTSRGGGGMMIMMPPMTRQFTNDDGSFTLENVPPGQTQLVVTAPGYTTGRVSGLNVEDGKPLDNVDVGLDTGVKLVGRVTGPDGAPLSGVSVSEDDMAAPGGRGVMRVNAGVGGGGAMTDPNGEYTLDSLEPGQKTFTFTRSGYLSDQKTVSLSNKETRLDEQLSSGQPAMGQVVTDAGGPVADATVAASSAAEGFGQRVAHSDGNGNFQFEGLAPGHYTFTASKNGWAPGVLRDFDISTGAPVRVVMSSGGTITGHVTGLAASDLSTATVTANNTNGNASSPVDSSGNYQILGAPTGTVRVSARTGQMFGGSGRTTQVITVQVDAGSTATADLVFKNDTTVSGHVTRGGQPVPNVTVAFRPRSTGVTTAATGPTDGSGAYQLIGLDDASYSVQVMDLSSSNSISFTTTHDVKGTGTFDIDVTGAGVHGRVTDATTGQPIDGAQVELRASGVQGFIAGRGTQTDSSGNFSMSSVAPGSYTAGVVKPGYGDDPKDVVVASSEVALELKIAPSNGITLKVVDGRDQRMLVAMATVLDAQGRASDTPPFRAGSPEPLQLTLSPGTYHVTVSASGYAAQTVTISAPSSQTVALTPGGTLVIHSKSSAPSVRLIDSAGNVYSRGFGLQNYSLNPSPGSTTIPYIPGGVYRIEVLDANGSSINSTSVTIVDGGQADVSL